jgi:hypothetical protein
MENGESGWRMVRVAGEWLKNGWMIYHENLWWTRLGLFLCPKTYNPPNVFKSGKMWELVGICGKHSFE